MHKSNSRSKAQRTTVETLESRTLLSAGALDTTFSGDGKLTKGDGGGGASDVAVQVDGKVVAVGCGNDAVSGKSGAEIIRWNANGAIDTTFGANHDGTVTLPQFNSAATVGIQSDGKIVIAGEYKTSGLRDNIFGIARLTTGGKLDTTFDKDGIATVAFGNAIDDSSPADLAIQKDGKIVVAGTQYAGTSFGNSDMAIARLNVSGSIDKTFGTVVSGSVRSGQRLMGFGGNDTGYAVTIDYNGTAATNSYYGTIVVAGVASGKSAIARLKPNGDLDTSLDGDGKAGVPFAGNALAQSVVVQPGGKILLCGSGTKIGLNAFSLIRLLPSGKADSTFGELGTGQVFNFFNGASAYAHDLVVGYANQLIVAGQSGQNFAVAAYSPNGYPDLDFSGDGSLTTSLGSFGKINGIATAPGHKFVVAGFSSSAYAIARYFDLVPKITISTLDTIGSESNQDTAEFNVSRPDALPFATRVFYTLGGTATAPSTIVTTKADFTGIPAANPVLVTTRYVDIPANKTSATIRIRPVDDTIHENTETAIFTLSPDANYLLDTRKSVTLTIVDNDPVTLAAKADAYVRDGASASTNFGSSTELQVKSVAGLTRLTYLKFDLTGITTINDAKLSLYGKLNNATGINVLVAVYAASDTTWNESTINYNNRPAIGSAFLVNSTILDTTPRWYFWDISVYLRAQIAAGKTSVTLVAAGLDTSSPYATFNSREAAANRPQLIVS